MRPITANSTVLTSLALDWFKHAAKPGGRRFRAESVLSTRLANEFSEIDLKVGGEYLKHLLTKPNDNQSGTMSVGTGFASADAQIYFDRYGGDDMSHRWTLNPRVKLLVTDRTNHANLPNFDTTLKVLDSYDRLFQGPPLHWW